MARRKLDWALAGGVCAFLLASAGLSAPAAAGTLQIDPVRLEIGKARKTASLTVRNVEDAPVTIQAHALGWSQQDGGDTYQESAAVIVSPPIFTVPPGGTQIVRVGLRNPAASEGAYRLIVEEVPEAAVGTGVRVALRLDIPLYAGLQPGKPGELAWSVWRDAQRGWIAEAANRGSGYVRVEPEELGAAVGLRLSGVTFGTVLPGSRRRWMLGERIEIADQARFESLRLPEKSGQNTGVSGTK
ncbi:fimbrial biogenesis chaperone [Sphingomonas parva]|nr:molecular chaperone [Sphingomonas parva]